MNCDTESVKYYNTNEMRVTTDTSATVVACATCLFDDCVCQPFWKEFDKELLKTYISQTTYDVSPVTISTITVNFEIASTISLEKFSIASSQNESVQNVQYVKGSKKSKDLTVNNDFYNQCQITLKHDTIKILSKNKKEFLFSLVDYESNIKIAIFKNGSIKIVGCRTMSQIVNTVQFVYKVLKSDPDTTYGQEFHIHNVRMSMINGTFYINALVKRDLLYRRLTGANNPRIRSVTFDTEKNESADIKVYTIDPAIAKVMTTRKKTEKKQGEITIRIFGTGAILINGAQSIHDIVKGYIFINTFFTKNPDLLTVKCDNCSAV